MTTPEPRRLDPDPLTVPEPRPTGAELAAMSDADFEAFVRASGFQAEAEAARAEHRTGYRRTRRGDWGCGVLPFLAAALGAVFVWWRT